MYQYNRVCDEDHNVCYTTWKVKYKQIITNTTHDNDNQTYLFTYTQIQIHVNYFQCYWNSHVCMKAIASNTNMMSFDPRGFFIY